MVMRNVVYCGNIPAVADEIYLNKEFKLVGIIVEDINTTNEILYLSYLREIPIFKVSNKKDLEKLFDEVFDFNVLALICGFGVILSERLLSKINAFNFHPGVLPNYKGRHPTFFATVNGDSHIGVTLHKVVPGIDKGPILGIHMIPYGYKMKEDYIMKKIPKSVRKLSPKILEYLNGEHSLIENIGGKYYKPVSEKDKTFTKATAIKRILNIDRAQTNYKGGIFINDMRRFWVKGVIISDISDSWIEQNGVFFKDNMPIGLGLTSSKALFFKSVTEYN